MNNLTRINTSDIWRPLLTEVLPYEVPLWFSNTVLHERKSRNCPILDSTTSMKGAMKPLDYKVKRTKSGWRYLSIMHPIEQLNVCDFYNNYAELITYYCRRSEKSLRHPSKIASVFNKRKLGNTKNTTEGVEEIETENKHASSYFSYGKYAFLYRFYESYEYHNLEKKFNYMGQVDVAKCFNNIYSHSISWAVKNKKVAKRDLQDRGGFDRDFDSTMQKANYKETNGILIGPEVSRIFAEIIMQDIDLRIIQRLYTEKEWKAGAHYDFRRYVDDFFVFTHTQEDFDVILSILEEELAFYKLHLNEAKTLLDTRPFLSEISLFKNEYSNSVEYLYSKRFNESGNVLSLSNPSKKANKTIFSIKSIVKKYDVNFSSVSNYILSIYQRKIYEFIANLKKSPEEVDTLNAYKWLLVDIDTIFFIHAMDPRVVPTDKVAKIIKAILDLPSNIFEENQLVIHKKIFDLGRNAISIFKKGTDEIYSVEILNMLLIMSKLDESLKLSPTFLHDSFIDKLEKVDFDDESSYEKQGGFYFCWVSLMFYITNEQQYDTLRSKLEESAASMMAKCPIGLRSTEIYLFFFDFVSCPYLDFSLREKFVTRMMLKNKFLSQHGNASSLITKLKDKGMIVEWTDPDWFEKNLLKRDYIMPYE